MQVYGGCSSTVPHQRNRLWVAPESFDIPLDPSKRHSLIFESEISRATFIARAQKSENAQSILNSDQNHISRVHEIFRSRIICRSKIEPATVQVCNYGKTSAVLAFRTIHVQVQAILISRYGCRGAKHI